MMKKTALSILSCVLTACASAEHPAPTQAPGDASAAPSAADATAAHAEPTASATATAPSAPTQALPASDAFTVKLVFESRADFFITGEKGRMALLANEDGAVVPYKFEGGTWERTPLPEKQRAAAEDSSLGIWFGRDNRPRLMGFRDLKSPKMVYLRFKDGSWQDQRSELGSLAGEGAALFGVLGEADPEVVCRLDSICLLKSRKGWQEVERSITPEAVVRAFHGAGYALTNDGLFRAGKKTFERVGDAAPWTTKATGFWIGEGPPMGALAIVAEPEKNLLHILDRADAAWRSEPSPIDRPADVIGPDGFALVVGSGGIAARKNGEWKRVGEPSWSFDRAIWTPTGFVVAGPSGVASLTAK